MDATFIQFRWVLLWKGYVEGDYPPLNDIEPHFNTITAHH